MDTANLLHAADIWFSVKKHWCLEAQRLVRALCSHCATTRPLEPHEHEVELRIAQRLGLKAAGQ